jgi:hypothetical protein
MGDNDRNTQQTAHARPFADRHGSPACLDETLPMDHGAVSASADTHTR